MLRVTNLSIKIDGKLIIKNLNLQLEDGELCFLSGGLGKSILCLAFSGLLKLVYPDAEIEGEIYLDDEKIESGVYNPKIAIVLENPYAQLSGVKQKVFDEIAFGLELNGIEPAEISERVLKTSEIIGISHLLDRDPRNLSGGETQRVVIACSHVMKPKLWILDRPFTELDENGRIQLIKLMLEETKRGTIVIITDDEKKDLLEKISSKLLILKDDDVLVVKNTPIDYPQWLNELKTIKSISFNIEKISGNNNAGFKLTVQGLKFGYKNGSDIFNGFNFEAQSGDLVLITGPNGSGKTTFAKLIAGILKPKSGKIEFISGQNSINLGELELWEISKYVAYAFQNPDLQLFSKTVYDELNFTLKVRGYSKEIIDAKIQELLKFFGLWELKDIHPHNLKRSHKKLLSVIIAYSLDTPILILDEPFQYQDEFTRLKITESIKSGLKQGKIIIVITHHQFQYNLTQLHHVSLKGS